MVAGWVIRYFLDSFTGAYMADSGEHFAQVTTGLDAMVFHAVFMAAVIAIVVFGIQRGIELAVRVLVPAIVVILVGLAVYAGTLDGAGEAYTYYLSPEFGTVADDWRSVLPAAAGQAMFTLSLGMGVMITYASYLSTDRNLAADGLAIIVLDTGISIVVGLIVFPVLFTAGVAPADPGPGAIFVGLSEAFAAVPFGRAIGAIFFGMFALAALTSAISLLEVVVSYFIDERGVERTTATVLVGGGIFLLGLPVAYDQVFLGLYDELAATVLLTAGALLIMLLAGWVVAPRAKAELARGVGDLGLSADLWIWLVRIPVVLALLVSLYLGVVGYVEFLREEFLPWVGDL